ncbi:Lambda-carrageenase [Pontiella desulfatans]|uniref:Lambda-carrageenase n=2 Tax=Pontiella desulfatans TaxID=2750659 RepID=A0A6C2UDZ0_PONDE|nr:Lambda-carrageenase [Pontiella desulfatans]
MKTTLVLTTALMAASAFGSAITSIETGHTICKVRTAQKNGASFMVASDYDGTIMAVSPKGSVGWKNELSGFMNHDLWCADITGDKTDEILAANADGHLYCLDANGNLLWRFKASDAPMNAVCVVRKGGVPYIVCGSYDMNIYYLSPEGSLVKAIESKLYSKEKPWGKSDKILPEANKHVANFIRPIRRKTGGDAIAVHAAIWSTGAAGHLYCFEPLEEKPFNKVTKLSGGVGELRTADLDGDGNDEVLTGATSMIQDAYVGTFDIDEARQKQFGIQQLKNKVDGFGYRVVQPELVKEGKNAMLFVLFGSKILLLPTDLDDVDAKEAEVLANRFSYNDMWKPEGKNLIVLASAQSGGSCIHIINLDDPDWKHEYAALQPPGNITAIINKTAEAREQLQSFKKPSWEKDVPPVTFMTDNRDHPAIAEIEANHTSPVFMNGKHLPRVEDVDRSSFDEVYRKKRDRRKKYILSSDGMVKEIAANFDGAPGIAYWGGHGNDPFQTSLQTQKKIFDMAREKGKKVVTIYPELEQHDEHFAWVLENHFYPMAQHARGKNCNIFIRTKHGFWNGIVYLPMWSKLISGEYADVFVPALEETTDKTMEQSVAARLGIWAAGSVDQWGARCARDNTSFDRTRQHSHQELPNHFLRQMIYNISCGATYLNNFPVDQDYMSILWELIAKGALYVPGRSELVSLSPVHLGMTTPDERFLDTGNNVKWMTFFNQQEEDANPMVFGRLNGSWPGAPNTEWDFSRYAAGVNDRRLNYLPPYPNGIVMMTPPQTGTFADPSAPRGKLADHLHPMYKGILKEYITDGRNYISADGTQTFKADEYYKTIETDIIDGAKHLPVTVSGDVAWVCAQTSPTHLRLTLIDGGYIDPSAKTATVKLQNIKATKMTDLLSKETFDLSDPSAIKVGIDCGLFRFIDIELTQPFTGK